MKMVCGKLVCAAFTP
ncbi:hypothetical protein QX213_20865 [Vibrio vulnificus]|nr:MULTISPECIES: hypothetical protein [Vibrio]MCU8439384.1 hypothetical protein [Vibrio vulnificus]MDC8111482.1 hypothetical protein [Vibrio sp. CCUG 15886]MDK2609304.1 hypothetical protein [Vibrio vulnificus]MDK2648928.1 hypothetical protein [Vibrio vulnificus]MDK2692605.1 hypothetical protein [Vibrio vulnificus]